MSSKILALIPARSGSKGVKNKNTLNFNNKPLLFWSIEEALKSKMITDVMVSSDSNEILELCEKQYNNILLDKRPFDLSGDLSKTIDLLKYILKHYKSYDYICVLQPTSPLRKNNIIDNCCDLILKNKTKEVLASGYISFAFKYGSHHNKPRQELDGYFYDDGNIYILKSNIIRKGMWFSNKRIEYINQFPYTLEIDTIEEFETLEIIHKNLKK